MIDEIVIACFFKSTEFYNVAGSLLSVLSDLFEVSVDDRNCKKNTGTRSDSSKEISENCQKCDADTTARGSNWNMSFKSFENTFVSMSLYHQVLAHQSNFKIASYYFKNIIIFFFRYKR